jgi:hypothetical protein
MRELGLMQARFPVYRVFLGSLAVADMIATASTLWSY